MASAIWGHSVPFTPAAWLIPSFFHAKTPKCLWNLLTVTSGGICVFRCLCKLGFGIRHICFLPKAISSFPALVDLCTLQILGNPEQQFNLLLWRWPAVGSEGIRILPQACASSGTAYLPVGERTAIFQWDPASIMECYMCILNGPVVWQCLKWHHAHWIMLCHTLSSFCNKVKPLRQFGSTISSQANKQASGSQKYTGKTIFWLVISRNVSVSLQGPTISPTKQLLATPTQLKIYWKMQSS